MYHLGSVDIQYHGQITAKGIIVHRTKIIPDIFYKINRWMGYIGAATCTFAAIFIGPAAFVGVGGFALMALVRGERKRTTEVSARAWDRSKPYRDTGPGIHYSDQVTAHWYIVKEYRRTAHAGRNSIMFVCPEHLRYEIEDVITRYINIVEVAIPEAQPQ
ncbi:hypothetical protein L4C34_04415 [Vibrio profundum]|uniref:hypothetical protein n=1 Tax=Vibrio profundum TaxID=2910247 RepID=UPI003D10993C